MIYDFPVEFFAIQSIAREIEKYFESVNHVAEKKFLLLRSYPSSVDSLLLLIWSTFNLTLSLDYTSPLSSNLRPVFLLFCLLHLHFLQVQGRNFPIGLANTPEVLKMYIKGTSGKAMKVRQCAHHLTKKKKTCTLKDHTFFTFVLVS